MIVKNKTKQNTQHKIDDSQVNQEARIFFSDAGFAGQGTVILTVLSAQIMIICRPRRQKKEKTQQEGNGKGKEMPFVVLHIGSLIGRGGGGVLYHH